MVNNTMQKDYLDILKNQNKKVPKENVLPAEMKQTNSLLPVIIDNKKLALIEIKQDFTDFKKEKNVIGFIKFTKNVAIALFKFAKACVLTSTKIILFVAVAISIVVSTAVVTKNIINSYYGVPQEKDTTYSIFKMKEDKEFQSPTSEQTDK